MDSREVFYVKTRVIDTVKAAVVAGLYAGLVYALAPISFQEFQIRVADALLILPFLDYFGFPAVIGLAIGCAIANLASPFGVVDIAFGSFANLAAGLIAWIIGRRSKSIPALILASILEALAVSLVVGYFVLYLYGGIPDILVAIVGVLVGSLVSISVLGVSLALFLLKRLGIK